MIPAKLLSSTALVAAIFVISDGVAGAQSVSGENNSASIVQLAQLQTEQAVDAELDDDIASDERSTEEVADTDEDEVIATGTRLDVAASQVAKQKITIDSTDIAAIGEPDLARTLARLPQNYGGVQAAGAVGGYDTAGLVTDGAAFNINGSSSLSLRGLGSDETLVLVNGVRIGDSGMFGGSNDISSIPVSAVERVEVILGGASAIYGSDAVGGVVNIILKSDYQGYFAEARAGMPTDGGMRELGAAIGGTVNWELDGGKEGFLTATLDYEDHTRLQYSDVDAVTTTTIDPSFSNARALGFFSPPHVAVSRNGGDVYTSPDSNAVPSANDLTLLGSPADAPRYPIDDFQSLTPDLERISFVSAFGQDVTENIRIKGGINYSKRDTVYDRGPVIGMTFLKSTHPFNPLGTNIRVLGVYPSQGLQQNIAETTNFNANLGIEGEFSNNWAWSVLGDFNMNETDSVQTNPISPTIRFFTQPFDFNPWGDGLNNSQDVLDSVFLPDREANTENKERGIEATIKGDLFKLPAGPVRSVFGVSLRKRDLTFAQDTLQLNAGSLSQTGTDIASRSITGQTSAIQDMVAEEKVKSVFAEAFVPLMGDRKGIHDLNLTAAIRYDDYDTQGNAELCVGSGDTGCIGDVGAPIKSTYDDLTYSLGAVYAPNEQLRIKAEFSTAFVTPDLIQSYEPVTERFNSFPQTHPDTGQIYNGGFFCTGRFGDRDAVLARFGWDCNNPSIEAFELFGGNPNLKPQESENFKIGIELDLTENLTLHINQEQIDYKNKTAYGGDVLTLPGAWDAFPELVTFADAFNVDTIDSRWLNLAVEEIDTLDIRALYDRPLFNGDLNLDFQWSLLLKYDQSLGEEFGVSDRIGVNAPKKNAAFTARWADDNWALSWNTVYRGKTSSNGKLRRSAYFDYESTMTHNASIGYEFDQGVLADTLVSLSVTNIFKDTISAQRYRYFFLDDNFEPDGDPVITGNVGDPRGRMVNFRIRKQF